MFSEKSENYPSEKEGVIQTKDVRRALMYDSRPFLAGAGGISLQIKETL